MDNNKKDPANMVDDWLNEILDRLNIEDSADEGHSNAQAADASHSDDMELERIVQETLAENWGDAFGVDEPVAPTESDENNHTRSFKAPLVEDTVTQPEEDAGQAKIDIESYANDTFPKKPNSKHKNGYSLFGIPHIISTIIWLCIIIATGVSVGRLVWVCAADLLALGKEAQEVTITIDDADSLDDISEKLKKAGMIRYPQLFEIFASLTGKGNGILTGSITFSGDIVYDYNALINAMSYRGGSSVTVEVMIPEGYSCAQIFELLDKKGVCSVSELEEYAINGELKSYWFLDGVKRGHKYCLEGFMFPDTYEFYLNDEPRRVIEKFLNVFDYRFTDRMMDKLTALNQKTKLNLTIRDVVIIASMVEKEKASNAEGYSIASVFYNRLTHASSYPFLNSDATIHYATEYYSKGELTTDALINASPYNTYTQTGLPAGPISNPGLSSLDAALDPEDTRYYFFIYDKNAGMHRFSKTLAEHNEWARKLGLA